VILLGGLSCLATGLGLLALDGLASDGAARTGVPDAGVRNVVEPPVDYMYDEVLDELVLTDCATVHLPDGEEVIIVLYPEAAPETVQHFIDVIRVGGYNHTHFYGLEVYPRDEEMHRLPLHTSASLVFGATHAPHRIARAAPVDPVPNEYNYLHNIRGAVSAHTTPRDSRATGDVSIALGDGEQHLRPGGPRSAHGNPVFGRVVVGLDILLRIASQPVSAVGVRPGEEGFRFATLDEPSRISYVSVASCASLGYPDL
jgi:cyclophilin family peptidyl-prolyl cis-trans isomerase